MTVAPLALRVAAQQDIDEAADHYFNEAGVDVTLGFIEAVQRSFQAIAANPLAGSPRYATLARTPTLRHRRVKRFPYLVSTSRRRSASRLSACCMRNATSRDC